jgi:tryptophan synthase alpha chain
MMDRLATTFSRLKAVNRAGLIAYVMAGDPDLATTLDILNAIAAAGADVIELGFPFTDPMADGPAIQSAGLRALKSGTTLAATIELAGQFRAANPDTPLILMGYANPIEAMGEAVFAARAAAAGVDGAIVVDLPPEEDSALKSAMQGHNLHLIRLATPTTDHIRMPKVLEGGSGFLYYVSVTGVTGAKAAIAADAQAAVGRLKALTDLPIVVGFGVRDAVSAAAIARFADGVVVGSAFVEVIEGQCAAGRPDQAAKAVAAIVKDMAQAIAIARQEEGKTS